ncbi:MAG: GTP-binding protein [Candidatus Lokiarchaeota archaeon]|nr:GTP-binding protein [Candidatus Lokiarchaeota archaeon]
MAKINIFVFGLNKVGKTTLVEYLREKKFVPQTPTIGVSISQIIFANLTMEFTDVGGQKQFRQMWEEHLKQPHVLVYVIDASDREEERVQDGRNELHKLLKNPKATGIPLLVLINKIDVATRMQKQVVEKKFALDTIKDRELAIYEVSAMTGKNLDAVLNALTTMVLKDEGIEYFVNEQVKQESKQLLDRYKKFTDAGTEAYRHGQLEQALASLNIAKEIAANLFQLGILSRGKDIQKLSSMIARIEKQQELVQAAAPAPQPSANDEQEEPGFQIPSGLPTAAPKQKPPVPAEQAAPQTLADQLKAPNVLVPNARTQAKKPRVKTVRFFAFGTDVLGVAAFKDYVTQEKYNANSNPMSINMAAIAMGNVDVSFNEVRPIDEAVQNVMPGWNDPELVVFIADATKPDSFSFAKRALLTILSKQEAKDKPVLVLVNNFDGVEAQPLAFIDKVTEIKRTHGRDVGIYQVSIKYDYNMNEPLNFVVSTLMKDKAIEKVVSAELTRRIDSLKQMYEAFTKEAKALEKNKQFQEAFNRVAKAKLIQEELFKYNPKSTTPQLKFCEEWMSKLRVKSIK